VQQGSELGFCYEQPAKAILPAAERAFGSTDEAPCRGLRLCVVHGRLPCARRGLKDLRGLCDLDEHAHKCLCMPMKGCQVRSSAR
jgi:hypothetical protein